MALLPLLAWLIAALLLPLDGYQLSAAFAMLVVFPLALLLDTGTPPWLVRAAHALGPVAAASLLMERGPLAACLASIWLGIALLHLAYGAVRFINAPCYTTPVPWAEASSAAGPVVAAVALVWSRYNGSFAGFSEPLATLTVTHFHFTFGLLPITLAALVRGGFLSPLPVWGVVFAPPLVGVLFASRADPAVPSLAEAGVIIALALSVAALSLGLRGRAGLARAGVLLLALGTGVAAWFSAQLALGQATLGYDQMLRWHGLVQVSGTALLGLFAYRNARFQGAVAPVPRPDLLAPTRDVAPEKAIFKDKRVIDLGPNPAGRFDAMADALLHYQFYPAHVMAHRCTFEDEGRHARPGDRIGMVLLVPLLPGYPAIALPATTEVFRAEIGPEAAALGYLTTTSHYGKGAWCAEIRPVNGRIELTLTSRMTPRHALALLGLPIYRWFQKRAHRLGAARLGEVQAP